MNVGKAPASGMPANLCQPCRRVRTALDRNPRSSIHGKSSSDVQLLPVRFRRSKLYSTCLLARASRLYTREALCISVTILLVMQVHESAVSG